MHADIASLFCSSTFRVLDYTCRMEPEGVSHLEYAPVFDISFTRQGQFGYHVGRHAWEIDSRRILLNNAGNEYRVSHGRRVCDECTVIEVSEALLEEAQRTFWQKDYALRQPIGTATRYLFPRPVLPSTPALEYLHQHLHTAVQRRPVAGSALKLDEVLVRLIEAVFQACYGDSRSSMASQLDAKPKERHLETVERAKHFMLVHFQDELSLEQIARAAYVSPFHFSRLFKQLTGHSPYQYLIQVRLNHAALLLRNTSDPVTEVCLASGFNSLSHFSETFSRHFEASPSLFRRQ